MTTTNKPFYKNIVLLTSEKGRESIARENINSDSLQKRIKLGDLIIIAIGGKRKSELLNSEHGDHVKILNLRCKEEYSNLAMKTFLAIKFINNNFTFNRLHKGDDNKYIDETFYDFSKNKFDLQGCSTTEVRPSREELSILKKKDSLIKVKPELFRAGLGVCKKRAFQKWARKKELNVETWHFDERVWYSTWKPYSLSSKLAGIISQADNYAALYVKYLGGCEDHMIGKVYKDMQLYFNLTAE